MVIADLILQYDKLYAQNGVNRRLCVFPRIWKVLNFTSNDNFLGVYDPLTAYLCAFYCVQVFVCIFLCVGFVLVHDVLAEFAD